MTDLDRILQAKPEGELEVQLGPGALEQFRAQGFVRVERITSDQEVQWLRAVYDLLFETRSAGIRGGYFDLTRRYESEGPDRLPQLLLPEKRLPELLETIFHRNGRRLAALLLDEDPRGLEVGGHMIQKPPGGAALPWHQDEAYWDPRFDHEAIGVWMPLDDATLENGCLHFIPGSHRAGVRTHRHIDDDPSIHGLQVEGADLSDAVAMPVRAGGALLHHCRTLHCSGPNRTRERRRAYTHEFQAAPVPRSEPADRPWIEQTRLGWARRPGG
ncbi:MAG: phytanoyl-CoA dioxygenase family protein [Myxococcota bacterium]